MGKSIRLLPSYVGSKLYWLDYLKNRPLDYTKVVELFSGSAVLSFNLSNDIVLNDVDKYLISFINNFNEARIKEPFTVDDYYKYRAAPDWHMWLFCLQKMSFSGVYRWSKNGYNVPPKKSLKSVSVIAEYLDAREAYNKKKIKTYCSSYLEVPATEYQNAGLILDPPYENSKAAYNRQFDYHQYWEFVRLTEGWASYIILFDANCNMPFPSNGVRTMTVNGKHSSSKEGVFIFESCLSAGQEGERLFKQERPYLISIDGKSGDFLLNGSRVELKSDYYDENKTENFFIERWSSTEKKSPGGPWQASSHNCEYFVYYFTKSGNAYWFKTQDLIEVNYTKYKIMDVPNRGYITSGYLVPRSSLDKICLFKENLRT